MNNPDEIRKLAHQRLKEAQILFENKMCEGAFYLASYSVEMTLKEKICERIVNDEAVFHFFKRRPILL